MRRPFTASFCKSLQQENRRSLAVDISEIGAHRRPCNAALAASTTVGRLQGGCHGESSSLQLLVAVPAHNRRSTLLSSRCITPMELTANLHSVISIPTCFPSTSKNISGAQIFDRRYLVISTQNLACVVVWPMDISSSTLVNFASGVRQCHAATCISLSLMHSLFVCLC